MHDEAVGHELTSAMALMSCHNGLFALFAVESQMADAVIEQGRGLRMGAQRGDIDMPVVGQDFVDEAFEQVKVIPEVAHCAKDAFAGLWELLANYWQDKVAQLVATVFVLGIGAVGHIVLAYC